MATTEEVNNWFIGKARSAAGYRRNIVNNQDRTRGITVIGKMYFFYYDPKHKKTLPLYDKFPLVFPIERYADGFLGINLHYLSIGERSALLSKLQTYRSNNKMNETTKLRLSYDLLQSTRSLASATRPCIKRYLFSHVRSPFVEVTANEWDMAAQLPVAVWIQNS
jgi:hypothetical protein